MNLTAVLIEGIKAQQILINNMQTQINNMQTQINTLLPQPQPQPQPPATQ